MSKREPLRLVECTSESLLDWAQSVQPSWAFETLIPLDQDLFRKITPFVKSDSWTAMATINVFSVIGTRHPRYQNWSWLKLLQDGKRMKSDNLPLYASNPTYYDGIDPKLPPMSFITFKDDELYIDGGNHRMCIAKFACARDGRTQLHGVGVKRLSVDWELYYLLDEITRLVNKKALKVHVQASRVEMGREDSPGWKIDRFDPILILKDFRKGNVECRLNAVQAKQWLSDNSQTFFGKWFR
jgi:hypothetical protein